MPLVRMCCPICAGKADVTKASIVHKIDGRIYRNKTVITLDPPLNTSVARYQELYLRCQNPTCTDATGNPTRWVVEVSFLRMISPSNPQDFIDNMRRINGIRLDKSLQRQLLEQFDNGYLVESVTVVPVSAESKK